MPGLSIAIILGILAAAGIILVAGYLTISLLRSKLIERHNNFWIGRIKDKYETVGVPVVEVSVEDLYGNTIGTEKFASLDGCSVSIGDKISKY